MLERAPKAVAGDSAYYLRTWLAERETAVVIPTRGNGQDQVYDREAYRERRVIERTINRLKRFRRIATRQEQLGSSYPWMVTFACILQWL